MDEDEFFNREWTLLCSACGRSAIRTQSQAEMDGWHLAKNELCPICNDFKEEDIRSVGDYL